MQATGRTLALGGRVVPLGPRAVVAAVGQEVGSMPRALQVWLAILVALMGAAAVAALIALPPGWEVFGTTPSFEWGLLIVGYVFFAIMTSGLCLASSLGTVFGIERFRPLEKRHAILALLSLTTAFGIIALDLHYPVRLVFGAMLVPSPSSPMWWMGVCYGLYLVVLVVEVWSMFTDHPRIHQAACTVAACVAVVAPTTLGAVFGVLGARPFWSGPFTPVYMIASAFLAGTSLLGIVFGLVVRLRLEGHERGRSLAVPSIRMLLVLAILAVALLLGRHVLAALNGAQPGLRASADALVSGPLAWLFWPRVVGGLALPLVLVALPATRTPAGLLGASLLSLAGVMLDRLLFVSAGEIAPITTASGTVSSPWATYVPSPVEVTIVVGAGAFVAFAYTLAERYLDLRESDVHVGLSLEWFRRRLRAPRAAAVAEVADAPQGGGQ